MRAKVESQGDKAVVTIEENSLPNIAVLTDDYKKFMQQVREHAMAGDYGRYHHIKRLQDVSGWIFTNYILAAGWSKLKGKEDIVQAVKERLIDDHPESIKLDTSKYEFQLPPKMS